MSVAAFIVTAAGWWLWIGAAVAAGFLLVGIDRIDEDARGAYVFRVLLISATLLIWPLILWRWWQLERDPAAWRGRYRPPQAHHISAVLMAVLIVAALVLGQVARQEQPGNIAPVRLSEAGT